MHRKCLCFIQGVQIYYNFVKKHEALKGKTPSEVAIPGLKFKTSNRWLELIELSGRISRNKTDRKSIKEEENLYHIDDAF